MGKSAGVKRESRLHCSKTQKMVVDDVEDKGTKNSADLSMYFKEILEPFCKEHGLSVRVIGGKVKDSNIRKSLREKDRP